MFCQFLHQMHPNAMGSWCSCQIATSRMFRSMNSKVLACFLSSFCCTHRSTSCWPTVRQQDTQAGAPRQTSHWSTVSMCRSILQQSAARTRDLETAQTNPETQTTVRSLPCAVCTCFLLSNLSSTLQSLHEERWRSGSELAPVSSLEKIREAGKEPEESCSPLHFSTILLNLSCRTTSMKRCLLCKSCMNCRLFRPTLISNCTHCGQRVRRSISSMWTYIMHCCNTREGEKDTEPSEYALKARISHSMKTT